MLQQAAQIPVRNVCLIGAVTLLTTCLPLLLPEHLKPNVGFAIAVCIPAFLAAGISLSESRRLEQLAEASPENPFLKATNRFYRWITFAWLPLPLIGLVYVIVMITDSFDPMRDDSASYGSMMALWASSLSSIFFACCACLALVIRFQRAPENFNNLRPRSFRFYWALQFPLWLVTNLVANYIFWDKA